MDPESWTLNGTLCDGGCLGAVLVGAEVAEPLLNAGGVPPSQVVGQPRVKLVESSGFCGRGNHSSLRWLKNPSMTALTGTCLCGDRQEIRKHQHKQSHCRSAQVVFRQH